MTCAFFCINICLSEYDVTLDLMLIQEMPTPKKPLLICNYLRTVTQSATHLLRLLHQRVSDILRLVGKAKSQVVKDDHSIVLAQLVWK